MARTHVIDIKNEKNNPVNETVGSVREDGTRYFDLDKLYKGQLDVHPGEIEGRSAATVNVRRGAVKLAGNARRYTSRFDGVTTTLHDFFSVGGWDADNFHRTTFQGPLVEGPQAFAVMHGVTLSAHKEPDELALLVEAGDVLRFLDTEFTVTFPRYSNNHMKLVPVEVAAAV